MMTAAANARGTLTDETESSASARQEAIGSLESNTDKLLNNLIVALERTDEVKTEAGKEVYSKKVTLPDIQGLLDKMDVLNTSITALKDNVTNAMTNMQSVMTQQVAAYNQVATQLGLINSSLQGFTQNVNTRLANIDQGVSAARTDVSGVQNGVNTANTTLTTVNSTTGIIKNNLDSVKSDVAIIKQNTTPV
jgi:septation ring formation regulator EzrA